MKTYVVPDELKMLAAAHGGECLELETSHKAFLKLRLKCSSGHVWSALVSKFRAGAWCPKCPERKNKPTIGDMMAIARSRGGECLSNAYGRARDKLLWRCKEGHEWSATPYHVTTRNQWCLKCTRKVKGTIEEMQKIAIARGGLCLSSAYVRGKAKLEWQCANGHRWEAPAQGIKQGKWCAYCANRKLNLDQMQEVAKARGGSCLSDVYLPSSKKMKWQCVKGHQWLATSVEVKSGTWCPKCPKTSAHTIEKMRELAAARNGWCLSRSYVNGVKKLKWKCCFGHTWLAMGASVLRGHWCHECAKKAYGDSNRLSIDDMREFAIKNGGNCVSEEYIGIGSQLLWECNAGHRWSSSPQYLKAHKSWCPACSHAGRAKKRRIFMIGEMKKRAEKRGGKCLSKVYLDSLTKLKWKCSLGHRWTATPAQITEGSWCPNCKHSKSLNVL